MKPVFYCLFLLFAFSCSKGDKGNDLPPTTPPGDSTQDQTTLLDEGFDNNMNGWNLQNPFTKDSFGLAIDQSAYYLTVIGPNRARVAYFPKKYFDDKTAKAQYADATMWQTQGLTDVGYGLSFSTGNTTDQYSFLITSEGYYTLFSSKSNGAYDSTLVDWTFSKLIKPLPEKNLLRIVRQKRNFKFYINQEQVAATTLSDDTPFDQGGFLVDNFKQDSTSVIVVDQLKLSQDQ